MAVKIIFGRKQLIDILGFVAIASKVSSSDTSVVLITTKNGRIHFRSTDHFLYLEVSVPIPIKNEIKVLTVLDPMMSFVGGSKSSKVALDLSEKSVSLQSSSSKADLKTVDVSSFSGWPDLDEIKNKVKCSKALLAAMKDVRFCASIDIVAPELYNLHLKGMEEGIIVEAADGHRLGRILVPCKGAEGIDVMIPLRAVLKLPVLEGKSIAGEVGNFVLFSAVLDNGLRETVLCRTAYGAYPDLGRILPKKFRTKITLDKGDLVRLLSAGIPFADQNYKEVRLSISNGRFGVGAASQGMGSFRSVAKTESFKGDDLDIIVDAKTVLDFVSGSSGSVSLEFNSKADPFRIRNDAHKEFVYLAWPLVRNDSGVGREE